MESYIEIRAELERRRDELSARLNRLETNRRQALHADSEEQASQLENSEVVDGLDHDARIELARIQAAFERMDQNEYGTCVTCDAKIPVGRLKAIPFALHCVKCAEKTGAS
jgi:DnaK suppressor protein